MSNFVEEATSPVIPQVQFGLLACWQLVPCFYCILKSLRVEEADAKSNSTVFPVVRVRVAKCFQFVCGATGRRRSIGAIAIVWSVPHMFDGSLLLLLLLLQQTCETCESLIG